MVKDRAKLIWNAFVLSQKNEKKNNTYEPDFRLLPGMKELVEKEGTNPEDLIKYYKANIKNLQ